MKRYQLWTACLLAILFMMLGGGYAGSVNATTEQPFSATEGYFSYNVENDQATITQFSYSGALDKLTIPEELGGYPVTAIGESAFSGRKIEAVVIPDGITEIGKSAFRNCSKLTTINIPDGVKEISSYTFSGCSELVSIDFGEGIEAIGENAFNSCSKLTAIVIPDSVKSIGTSAFSSCSALTDISIGTGLSTLENAPFSGLLR